MKKRKILLAALTAIYCLTALCCLLFHIYSSTDSAAVQTAAAPQSYGTQTHLGQEPGTDIPESMAAPQDLGAAETAEPHEDPVPLETKESPDAPEAGDITEEPPDAGTAVSGPIPFVCQSRLQLNIRNTPSMSGHIIGKIKPGGQGTVLDIIDEDWVQVSFQDVIGYCACRYLDFTLPPAVPSGTVPGSPAGNAPSVPGEDIDDGETAAGQTSTEDTPEAFITISKGCYIRSTPEWQTSDNILRTADTGASYPHIAEKDTPDFYAIRLPDHTAAYVSVYYSEPAAKVPEQ